MSYQEKRTIVSIITGILVLGAYAVYTYGKYKSGAIGGDELRFWAGAMLLFIGIGIVLTIVIQIVFHILLSVAIAVQEKVRDNDCDEEGIGKMIEVEMVTDEMDNLIGLKSARIGFIIAGAGFVAALAALFVGYPPAVMINIVFAAFCAGPILEGFAQLYYYRKGV